MGLRPGGKDSFFSHHLKALTEVAELLWRGKWLFLDRCAVNATPQKMADASMEVERFTSSLSIRKKERKPVRPYIEEVRLHASRVSLIIMFFHFILGFQASCLFWWRFCSVGLCDLMFLMCQQKSLDPSADPETAATRKLISVSAIETTAPFPCLTLHINNQNLSSFSLSNITYKWSELQPHVHV